MTYADIWVYKYLRADQEKRARVLAKKGEGLTTRSDGAWTKRNERSAKRSEALSWEYLQTCNDLSTNEM